MPEPMKDGIAILPKFTPIHLFQDHPPATVKIVSSNALGYTIINQSDYNAGAMTLYGG